METDLSLPYSRKQQILISAAKLFHKRGFRGSSLQAIAQEIGIEGPSLYNHIKSKNEILSTLLLTNAILFNKHMKEIKKAPITSIQKIDRIISLHIVRTLENPDAMALMLNEWVYLAEPDKSRYLALRDHYENDFLTILKSGIKEGELINIKVNLMLFIILAPLRSLYAWCEKYKKFNCIELENSIKESILQGVLRK